MTMFINKKLIGAVAGVLAILVLAVAIVFTSVDEELIAEVTTAAPKVETTESHTIDEDVLWLARVIYSETKRADEQELVAWVVRNRVETAYRGENTYRGVVLDPWQFSAFNHNAPKRAHYANLTQDCEEPGWATAVAIAEFVSEAPAYERPFETTTRHFYSERSMVGRSAPAWANGQRPVSLDRDIDERRFRFYANIL